MPCSSHVNANYSCYLCNISTYSVPLSSDNSLGSGLIKPGVQVVYTPPNNAGIKHDQGKARMELLSPIALEQIALVMAFGAKKYGDWNWAKGMGWSRLLGASLRHIFAFLRGEDLDPESKLPHLAHAGCCVLMLLDFQVTMPQHDDRRHKQLEVQNAQNKV